MKTKTKQDKYFDIKAKDINVVLFHQFVARARCKKVEDCYMALAHDIGQLLQNKKATNSASLLGK
jgi:hypothetical protein